MRRRAAALALACEAILTFGCGGTTDTADAGRDAATDVVADAPPDAADSGPPVISGDGTCTLAKNDASGDGGVLDGGGVAWPGSAIAQPIAPDTIEARCKTANEELRIVVAKASPNMATATLETWWGANATGTGNGSCTAQLSAAPWIQGTKGLIAVFGCGPIDMSWGGRVTVTGTVSAK